MINTRIKFKKRILNFKTFESITIYFMSKEIESYKLGNVQVIITETDQPNKLHVDCNDGNYHSEFTVRRYEFENYKRHMNQKIKTAYNDQYEEEG